MVMPSLPKSKNGNESIDAISNPLFFGAFADYEEDEYLDHMQKILFVMTQRGVFWQKIFIRVVKFYPLNIVN